MSSRSVPDWGWAEHGHCRGQSLGLFFGIHNERPSRRLAREGQAVSVCGTCPVRERCLEHALTMPERHGVWGGCTEEEISVLRQHRRASA